MPQGIKKEEPNKPTLSRRKEIIKTRLERNEMENRKTIKSKENLVLKISKIDNRL